MEEKEFTDLLYGRRDLNSVFAELAGKQALLLVKGETLNQFGLSLVQAGRAAGSGGVYLSLNESFKSLADSFLLETKANTEVPPLYFIDCVSTLTGLVFLEKERCIQVNGPTSLTELSLAISMALKKTAAGNRFLAFNAVNHFLVYNGKDGVSFLRKLLIKLRASNITGLFLAAREAQAQPRMQAVIQSFDTVVRL